MKYIFLLCGLGLVLFAALGFAIKYQDLDKKISVCAAIQSRDERLAAYDSLASSIRKSDPGVITTANEANQDSGSWSFKSEVSPLDDKTILTIYKDSEQSAKVGNKVIRPTLFIRFKEGSLTCSINYGIFIGTGSTTVTMRMDKEEPRSYKCEISNDHETIFYPSGVNWFIDRLIESKTLLIQLTPHGESSFFTSFDLEGLKEAIKPILAEVAKRNPS